MINDGWHLFFEEENNKTFALGDGFSTYDIHDVLQDECHENGRHCELIGSVDCYMKMSEHCPHKDGFQYVTNQFKNNATGLIDIVTYYIFDERDLCVYKNIVSVTDKDVIDIDQIVRACRLVHLHV